MSEQEPLPLPTTPKRKRGRPKGVTNQNTPKRGRGRPRKGITALETPPSLPRNLSAPIRRSELVDMILSHVPREEIARRFGLSDSVAQATVSEALDETIVRMSDLAEKMTLINLARLERMYQTWLPMALGISLEELDEDDPPPFANDKAARIVLDTIKSQQTILKDMQDKRKPDDPNADHNNPERTSIYIDKLELTLSRRSDLAVKGQKMMLADPNYVEDFTVDADEIYNMTEYDIDEPGKTELDADARPPSAE